MTYYMPTHATYEERERFAYIQNIRVPTDPDEEYEREDAMGFKEAAQDFASISSPEDLTERLNGGNESEAQRAALESGLQTLSVVFKQAKGRWTLVKLQALSVVIDELIEAPKARCDYFDRSVDDALDASNY